ncbi:MAG: hypothetical protein K0R63_1443 [Rickettsiales bacterium]|nr:hypothetical protein [Rickettsiales bacterium]
MIKDILFDNNTFDYFYNRGIDPFRDLPCNKYNFLITPEIEIEVFDPSTPNPIKTWVKQLLDSRVLSVRERFGFCTYDNLNPEGITGFATYNNYDLNHASISTYSEIMHDGGGNVYLNKEYKNSRKMHDALLASHSVYSIVLTCDQKDALKKAKDDGYQIVYLGHINPSEESSGFDCFSGTLEAYILNSLMHKKN